MTKKHIICLSLAFGCAATAFAIIPEEDAIEETEQVDKAAAHVEASPESKTFTWGADFRFRQAYKDDIPAANGRVDATASYRRYRTRIWGELKATEDVVIYGRLANEFRQYDQGANGWSAMDEIVLDNLYIDLLNLGQGDWDLRVGRQDLMYGNGRVLFDGTPSDGSRTAYFNAIKATYNGFAGTRIDFFGMYTPAEDQWAINSQDHNLTFNEDPSDYTAESGAGYYLKNDAIENMPFEQYYIWKNSHAGELVRSSSSWAGLNRAYNTDDIHTIGARFMPQISDAVAANLEVAYQIGEDISAYMIDSQVDYDLTEMVTVGAGWLILSGDDPETSKQEGWDPIFGRWAQTSDLLAYTFDGDGAGRWSNLNYPHINMNLKPFDRFQSGFTLGYLMALEEDGPDASNDGKDRGLYFSWKNDYKLQKGLLFSDDQLSIQFVLELMEPGDYYTDEQDNMAIFTRLQLVYSL